MEGKRLREEVYNEFRRYQDWKADLRQYDISDLILELIRKRRNITQTGQDLFQSVYLDECQDFSYAAIYLICSLAGKTNMQWVAAGDTAQMITPGCSFKFDGLKQTLLAIRPDVKLRKVEQLRKNYRMTKGTLQVGNALIRCLKKYFPHAIEYTKPETAMVDIGLRAIILDWDMAMKTKAKFGVQQAVIFSSDVDESALFQSITKWIGDHPFVLSSLESKGLEFDDVIVAFHVERKTWDLDARFRDGKTQASLKLLRELYVGCTRAKRR
eukprot:CAMPEP_0172513854 /NCGR_PEP_ID=MMETSP1066-20121228/255989_1 /TAXON_ID=671091 /ORGANISM="Coscinodiscus wailesii, Strain CCMP2513" /LENGTH=268 /DNA_ID=CAMNT_0013294293 /DNA_START=71 /DNA_END=874 /DNA_ORIENTATION=-